MTDLEKKKRGGGGVVELRASATAETDFYVSGPSFVEKRATLFSL